MQHFFHNNQSSQALAAAQPGRGSKATCQCNVRPWEALAGRWESRHMSQAELTLKQLKKSMANKNRHKWNGFICLDKSMASQTAILAIDAPAPFFPFFWRDRPSQNATNDLYHDFV